MKQILQGIRKGPGRLLLSLLALVLAAGGVVAASAMPAFAYDAFGTPEYSGSSWLGGNGVEVYSNGSPSYVSGTYDYITVNGQSIKVGMEWQCVELAQRLYTAEGWHSGLFPGVQVAADIWGAASGMGMTTQPNGSITSIEPGDMIIHGANDNYSVGAGHVAIVDYVSGSTVHAVQQNTGSATTTYTLSADGKSLSGGSGSDIKGVVHSPNDRLTNGSGGSVGAVSPIVASLVTSDGVRHIYSGTSSGGLYETWWSATAGPTTWQLTNVGSAVTGVSAQVTSDGNEHVYYGTQGGLVGEVWWGPNSNGVHMGQSWNMGATVTAISSQLTPDGVQHIYSSNAAGSLYETWWGSSSATTWQVLNVGVNITAISSVATSDGYQHIFYGATNGQVGEVWWGPGSNGGHSGYTSNVGTNVTAVTSQITSDGVRHIYSAAANGGLYETWWGYSSTGATTWQIANVGQHPTAVSSQITSDGNEHVYYGTSFGQVGEVWWGPNSNGVHLGQTYTDPSGTADSSVSSQVTSDGSQNVFFGNSSGSLFAMSWGVNPAVTSPVGTVG